MLQINLSNWRERKQHNQLRYTVLAAITLFLMTITSCVFWLSSIESDNQVLQIQIAEHQKTIQSTTLQINAAKKQQTIANWLQMQNGKIEEIENQQHTLLECLSIISQNIPHDLWLTKLVRHEKHLIVEGHALNYESIAGFVSLLNAHHLTKNLNVEFIDMPSLASYFSFRLEEK